jgi:hypothetical protein
VRVCAASPVHEAVTVHPIGVPFVKTGASVETLRLLPPVML